MISLWKPTANGMALTQALNEYNINDRSSKLAVIPDEAISFSGSAAGRAKEQYNEALRKAKQRP